MKIYIEQVLITNFIIDFCLLLITSRLVFAKPKYGLITLSAIFGSFASLIMPYCTNLILINTLKILTSLIMLQILHIHKRQLIISTLLMLVLSYIIGGAILSNFGTKLANGYGIKQMNLIYVFATTIIFTFITCKLIVWIKSKITTNSNIYDINLVNNGKKICIKSFIDSGNGLTDENQPVNIINFDTFSRLTSISLHQYLNNQFSTLTSPHFINANTIAGKRKILVFTIQELHLIKNTTTIFKNVKIGVSLNFDNSKEYKAILNSSFCLN